MTSFLFLIQSFVLTLQYFLVFLVSFLAHLGFLANFAFPSSLFEAGFSLSLYPASRIKYHFLALGELG